MAKIIVYEGSDIGTGLSEKKAAVISYASGFKAPSGILEKSFEKGGAAQAVSQMKRWISSASFDVLVFAGFGEAMSDLKDDDIFFWIKDHVDPFSKTSLVVFDDISSPVLSKVVEKRTDLDF